MRNIRLSLLTITVALFALACATQTAQQTANLNTTAPPASPAASVDEFAAAKAKYDKLCSDCHGKTGDGGIVQIDDKKLKVPSLKIGHALMHSDQQLVKQVLDGGEGMPAFKDKVSTAEAAELIRFVRHEFQAK
jgi:mono/diheme cytochrome c family protein